jgi:hypothetical protein
MAANVQNTGAKYNPSVNLTNAGRGRPKGVPNKVTAAAKSVIAEAAEKLGGVQRLVDWVKEDPENESKFWATIYPKLIPVQVTGEDGAPIRYEQVQTDADAFARTIASLAARAGTGIAPSRTEH